MRRTPPRPWPPATRRGAAAFLAAGGIARAGASVARGLRASFTIVRVSESEADVFGLNAAREPDGFAKVAMRLSEYRKIEPGPLEEAMFFDHPSGATRVRMSMQWKKDHVPGATMVTPALKLDAK